MTRETLLTIAHEHGTPLYAYDASQIRTNLDQLRAVFGPDVEVHFACKALSNRHILMLLRDWGCGIDAVSQGELQLALSCGYPTGKINFTPSGAPLEEYLWALNQGIDVHVDNLEILDLIGQEQPGAGLSLRFNPGVRGGGHVKLQVGASDSKFGIYPEELERLDAILARHRIRVNGVHVHVGSDVGTTKEFLAAWQHSFDMAERFGESVKVIDLGGGYKAPLQGQPQPLDLKALSQGVRAMKDDYERRTGHQITLMLEPGKFLVGNAGYFLVTVTSTKQLANRTFVYVNSGFNHFLRPMYYGATHQVSNLSRPEAPVGMHTVVGYLCETDTFAGDVQIAAPRRGDILCFENAGAYAMTMASNYNLRPRPAEVLWDRSSARVIRPAETIDGRGGVIWYES
ncbi:MAG: diaminopimelate decarboxylase [Saprospiraceae bacterium]|nr:diaminopimelate decarboxylase [Saprospiraceae bacterium]